MPSIFTKIVEGTIPCYKIAENEYCMAFLDIMPLKEGHTLSIIKTEIDYLFDVNDDLYQELMSFTKKVAIGLKAAIPCNRIGVAVVGLEVPHCHIHLIPIYTMDDMNFAHPKLKPTQDELALTAQKIRDKIVL
ncbi:MAG: HIT family protein [Cytophagales bacterium]|nr:HIT family protein [Cytophagales bacterium]